MNFTFFFFLSTVQGDYTQFRIELNQNPKNSVFPDEIIARPEYTCGAHNCFAITLNQVVQNLNTIAIACE